MSKTSKWIMGILAAAVAVLGSLVWNGCGKVDKAKADAEWRAKVNDTLKQVTAHYDSVDLARETAIKVHDSLQKKSLDSSLRLLKINRDSIKLYKSSLDEAVSDLGLNIDELNNPSIKEKFDSMVNLLSQYQRANEGLQSGCDTTINWLIRENAYKDSIRTALITEITDLKKALTTCTLNFEGLKTDFDKEAAKVKRQGLIAKIGTGLGIAAGFLLGHSLK